MANQYGIDKGNVLSKASDIKTARLNTLTRERDLENDKTDRAARLETATRQKGNTQKLASSDPRMEGYNVETPGELQKIQSFLDSADDKTKQQALQVVDTLGKYSMAILNSQDTVQKKQLWEQLKTNIPANAKGDMPEEYDEKWLTMKATEAKTIKDLIAEDVQQKKVKSNQEAKKVEYNQKLSLEAVKQKNKLAFDKAKIRTEKTPKQETKLKIEKLFDLRAKLKQVNPNDPQIAEVNKAIKLATEGKPSELGMFLAKQLGANTTTETKTDTKKDTKTETKVKTEADFIDKYKHLGM